MSLRRVAVLFGKELGRSPKNFFLVFAVVVPLVISFVVSLLLGSLFSDKPKLGIADEGASQVGRLVGASGAVARTEYASAGELRRAVETGAVDMGIVLPAGFDDGVARGEETSLTAYVWGQSLVKNRAILGATLVNSIIGLAGKEVPVEIVAKTLGSAKSVPWEDRLLPLVAMLTIVIGGSMVPASSLVDEKQKRTLTALTVTPTSLEEVFLAKGLLGAAISLLMGIVILVINQAFGAQPFLLILVLALGAVMAASFGILLGALVKDINTLFATVKAIGILLYAPALVYLFPQIPEWIGRIFPTYYMVAPIVEITQRGASWPGIALEVFILIGLILALFALIAIVARRARTQGA